MSIASIKAHADAIKAEADALPEPGQPAWPTGVNCIGGPAPSLPSFTSWPYWADERMRHSRMQGDISPGQIAFFGTSVTASMNVSRVHHAAVNYGIGGDTMRGFLNRLSYYTSLVNAGAVVLEFSINDAGYDPYPNIESHMDKIFGWLTGPLVVLNMIPQGNGYLSLETMGGVNAAFAAKLANRPNCALVDVTTALKDTDGFMKMSYSIGDRMHPNAAGYAVIRPLIQAGLAAVLS